MQREGTAVLKFERGEMQLALFRREDGFVWFHRRKPFGPPLATTAAAAQFLRDLCELYNYTYYYPPQSSPTATNSQRNRSLRSRLGLVAACRSVPAGNPV